RTEAAGTQFVNTFFDLLSLILPDYCT
ncbi:hypothetical protein pipiens_000561, partial [Culex pipiens pipiens]